MTLSPEDPVALEQPADDVFEQRREVSPEAPEVTEAELPLEADPADAADQLAEAGLDEDEQR
jgi:hypothetical protein